MFYLHLACIIQCEGCTRIETTSASSNPSAGSTQSQGGTSSLLSSASNLTIAGNSSKDSSHSDSGVIPYAGELMYQRAASGEIIEVNTQVYSRLPQNDRGQPDISFNIGGMLAAVNCCQNANGNEPSENYFLSTSTSGSGSISGPGISCNGDSGDCDESYSSTPNTKSFTATPADGWEFVGWFVEVLD